MSGGEIWIDIKGFEGIYQISNLGRVRSLDREIIRPKMGNFYKKGEILNFHVTPKGYFRIQLSKEGKTKNFLIHRLVAENFIDNPENKFGVNHKNSNRKDNRIENLEWATPSENLKHGYDFGYKKPSVKYNIKCIELNITTLGIDKMVATLKRLGYLKANSGSIWSCIKGINKTCCGLTFELLNKYE